MNAQRPSNLWMRRAALQLWLGAICLTAGWLTPGWGQAQLPAAPNPTPTPRAVAKTKAKRVQPPAPSAAEIAEARRLLAAAGYWVKLDEPTADASLRHALSAFQKLTGRPRTGLLTPDELTALGQAVRPVALEASGFHIEIDLDRQVLFIVNEQGLVQRILPISSGSGEWFTEGGRTRRALTPLGRFKIQRKITGWRKSALGLLYYPSYFFDGVAIHGNPSVPATPASHGCVRIPMFAAQEFFELTPVGTAVLIHGTPPPASAPPAPCKLQPKPGK